MSEEDRSVTGLLSYCVEEVEEEDGIGKIRILEVGWYTDRCLVAHCSHENLKTTDQIRPGWDS